MELPGWGPEDWVKPVSCLAEVCGLRENPEETTQTVDNFVWEHCDQNKNENGIDRRLSWRNRGESSECIWILQYVWFFRVTFESRTET